jgi:hypothetical protein
MNYALKLHPSSQCDAVIRIEVEVARFGGAVRFSYTVTGPIGDLRFPPIAAPARTDELWQHTCFEAFVRAVPGSAYAEFNFAPSTQWAAYRFTGPRQGMTIATEVAAPRILVQASPERFTLQTSVDLGPVATLPRDALWQLGLSAVIEEANGRKSYWALAHPSDKPDFHHTDSFALELAGVTRP